MLRASRADERCASAPDTAEELHTFNRCLDEAIAHAVTEYQRQRDESSSSERTVRAAMLAHELRNRLGAATLAFGILQRGTVAIGGSTGAVLGRTLRVMTTLVNNCLVGARLESPGQRVRVLHRSAEDARGVRAPLITGPREAERLPWQAGRRTLCVSAGTLRTPGGSTTRLTRLHF